MVPRADAAGGHPLAGFALASTDVAAAEERIRMQLGPDAAGIASRDEVILPLAEALLKATGGDPRAAVLRATTGVEAYLDAFAERAGVPVAGASTLNAKLDRLADAAALPRKLIFVGRYLGHVSDAADLTGDVDVGASWGWSIRGATGIEYVFVAASFIASTRSRELGNPPEI
jgi:hypothetical protein